MQWTSRGDVSIVELIVYFPSLFFAFLVCSRHGFHRAWGWIFTLILCLVRIIGACCQLATYHSQSKNLLEATFILEFVGLSPLLYATLGLLSRCIDGMRPYPQSSKITHFTIIEYSTHATIALALMLSIVGGTSITIPTSSSTSYSTPTTSKVGTILYLVAFFVLLLIALTTLPKLPYAPQPGEKRLLLAVLLALPFLATRLAYAVLSTFDHGGTFNAFEGSVVVYALMSVLMEFIVVVVYLVVGWFTDEVAVVKRVSGPRVVERRAGNGGRGTTGRV